MITAVTYALAGTGFTFLMTVFGAATVFFFRKNIKDDMQKIFIGFAAGVMIAASVWSLLIPAIEMASDQGKISFIPAAGGFILGALFLLLVDKLLPYLHIGIKEPIDLKNQKDPVSHLKRSTMLILAITLHNIPEGMAVGLAFAIAAKGGGGEALAGAIALAIGIGIQNAPEGAAISLPLKKEGYSKTRAFIYGSLSGIVEPIAGLLTVFIVSGVIGIMPWILSFAAGTMMFVVVDDLIPEANSSINSHRGTFGVLLGFIVMMILDVALG